MPRSWLLSLAMYLFMPPIDGLCRGIMLTKSFLCNAVSLPASERAGFTSSYSTVKFTSSRLINGNSAPENRVKKCSWNSYKQVNVFSPAAFTYKYCCAAEERTVASIQLQTPLIARRCGEWSSGEAHLAVLSVEDGVKPLEERAAVDEVQAAAGGTADVVDDELHVAGRAADERVERAGPDLSVGRELERRVAGGEEEGL